MIPAADVTVWGESRPWPDRIAVEQDMLLARAIIAIYEHPLLSQKLILSGGTCLHQVYLGSPRRYCADLDFGCRTSTGIGLVLEAVEHTLSALGLQAATSWARSPGDIGRGHLGAQMELTMLAPATDSAQRPPRVTIQINTRVTSLWRPVIRRPFRMESEWFSGETSVLTFTAAEMTATKINALYERCKGRDLFDMWLALTELKLSARDILACFRPYRPHGYTAAIGCEDLDAKLADPLFRSDLSALVREWPADYDIDLAGAMVRDQILRLT